MSDTVKNIPSKIVPVLNRLLVPFKNPAAGGGCCIVIPLFLTSVMALFIFIVVFSSCHGSKQKQQPKVQTGVTAPTSK